MNTRIVNGSTYHVHTNRHTRPLFTAEEARIKSQDPDFGDLFSYINADEWDTSRRLFEYLGSWYDYYEFEVASHDVKTLGFDGVQTDSYFSATVVCYFNREGYELDGEIIVGRIHW